MPQNPQKPNPSTHLTTITARPERVVVEQRPVRVQVQGVARARVRVDVLGRHTVHCRCTTWWEATVMGVINKYYS